MKEKASPVIFYSILLGARFRDGCGTWKKYFMEEKRVSKTILRFLPLFNKKIVLVLSEPINAPENPRDKCSAGLCTVSDLS